MTHEDLAKAFEKFGKILSAKVSIDGDFQSRCYGFVQLETEKATHNAISKMNDFVVEATETADEARLHVCEYVNKLDRVGTTKPRCSTNLYIKNFPHENFTNDELRSKFEQFGQLVNVHVQ